MPVARSLLAMRRGGMWPWFHAGQSPQQWVSRMTPRRKARVAALARGRTLQCKRAGKHNQAARWLDLWEAAA